VALEVEFAPNFVDEKEAATVCCDLGYSVSLVCAVEAFPPAQVTWIHSNIQKSDNEDNVDIYRGPGTEGFKSSTLRIVKLSPDDLGSYTCRANNKLGRAEQVIKVEREWSQNCEQNCVWEEQIYDNKSYNLTANILTLLLSLIMALN